MSVAEVKAGVIVADPNWAYKNWSDTAHGAAKAHYEGMSADEIGRIPVARWAADDCVLALWCTNPKLPEGVNVMRAWGFDYVTAIPWVKTVLKTTKVTCPKCQAYLASQQWDEIRRGVGFWTMSASEILLIGRRGEPKQERSDTQIGLLHGDERVFYAPIGRHSAKPEGIQDYLERRFAGPYLELFARRLRPNWTCWGLDLGQRLGEQGVEEA